MSPSSSTDTTSSCNTSPSTASLMVSGIMEGSDIDAVISMVEGGKVTFSEVGSKSATADKYRILCFRGRSKDQALVGRHLAPVSLQCKCKKLASDLQLNRRKFLYTEIS